MEQTMLIVWLVVIVLAVVFEGLTAYLISIWFVAGGLAGIIAYFAGAAEWLQILIALVVTLLCIIFTRPFVNRVIKTKKQSTNADRYIGELALVLEEINEPMGTGQVKVHSSIWTARCADESEIIEKGVKVKVLRIEGVKLIVEPITEEESRQTVVEYK